MTGTGQVGGGLVFALTFGTACTPADETTVPAARELASVAPNVYVNIRKDGIVEIYCHRSEMGQGIRTSLPQVIADEMEADWSRVKVEQAPGDAIYGNQNTDGSWSVRGFMQRMREAGATVRLMLEQSAAAQWGVDVAECRADFHTVVHQPSGRRLDYRELLAGAAELPVPGLEQLQFKSPDQFRYIGKGLPIVDLHDMTPHYAETLLRWRERFLARWDDIAEMGFDDEFKRLWEFYFRYCEGGFAEAILGSVQLVFAKPLARGSLTTYSRRPVEAGA